ncbi:F0F1 ATP synthase subunit alpha [Desulfonema ishimotonii]|uniref:ATP synthase subunit alpha n=1 Tax=Desulfonema ishimotonii TaxID=45657 RepID=A0A401FX07_9BACT|nr:alternate F1F0 ATPase, F1 subunit alpha [Desulfonema ishimotonii]GBC61495.1 F0F1 ATP synthase subunit alpha [Desulfonema ishimotonii]
MSRKDLMGALDDADRCMRTTADRYAPGVATDEIGRIRFVGQGIVRADGLGRVRAEELVLMGADVTGMVTDLLPDRVGIVLMESGSGLRAGDEVRRTGRILDVPVGESLIGRVVDPMGRPLDDLGPVREADRWPALREAPPILHRAPVEKPLQTGLKVVDALIPIGFGQRELILGDRQTGKTSIALDTILNQKGRDVICIYCAIGQRSSSVARVIRELRDREAMAYTVAMVVEGGNAPGLQYIAPYAATSVGEYFMAKGRDVIIVYDDLTRHAQAYRQLSLLLRRPPGREAFPGDIFYIHSRLLERSTHLKPEFGGGSLTALPVIETEAQNLSAYIPTNLISITDGQIYLSPDLFRKGMLPAVDVGKSVSRVGGRAQVREYRKIAGELRLSYSQFQELEAFARFGTRLDDRTRQTLEHGRRVREILKQDRFSPLSVEAQIAVLRATVRGELDEVPLEEIPAAEAVISEQ